MGGVGGGGLNRMQVLFPEHLSFLYTTNYFYLCVGLLISFSLWCTWGFDSL